MTPVVRLFILPFVIIALTETAVAGIGTLRTSTTQTPVRETLQSETRALQTQAEYWGLEIGEYRRYQALMDGPLGKWNPVIDPLLALGMFAESPQKEQHYAERYAQQEFELTERALRFQRAYRAAFARLYPDAKLLDHRLLAPYFQHQQQKQTVRQTQRLVRRQFIDGDRLLVFVSRDCSQCRKALGRLIDAVADIPESRIDLYVRGAPDDTAVQHWATQHQIPPQWLHQQSLTLNRDEGVYQRLQQNASGTTQSPMTVFLHRGGRFFRVDSEVFSL